MNYAHLLSLQKILKKISEIIIISLSAVRAPTHTSGTSGIPMNSISLLVGVELRPASIIIILRYNPLHGALYSAVKNIKI